MLSYNISLEQSKGKARFALNLDNTALYANETPYSNIIRKLHQAYGKKALTADEVASQIYALKLTGKDKESYMAFLSELDNLTMLYIQSGHPANGAYQTAIERLITNIPDYQRRDLQNAFRGIHTDATPAQKRFLEYQSWLFEYYS